MGSGSETNLWYAGLESCIALILGLIFVILGGVDLAATFLLTLGIFCLVVLSVIFVIADAIIVRKYLDVHPLLWGAGAILLPIISVPAYMYTRQRSVPEPTGISGLFLSSGQGAIGRASKKSRSSNSFRKSTKSGAEKQYDFKGAPSSTTSNSSSGNTADSPSSNESFSTTSSSSGTTRNSDTNVYSGSATTSKKSTGKSGKSTTSTSGSSASSDSDTEIFSSGELHSGGTDSGEDNRADTEVYDSSENLNCSSCGVTIENSSDKYCYNCGQDLN
jgi:hypothetical protein